MTDTLKLPELGDVESLRLSRLERLYPSFYVPKLEEKPQNPIIVNLESRKSKPREVDVLPLPQELLVLSDALLEQPKYEVERVAEDIWELALRSSGQRKHRIASWDTLRRTCEDAPLSPFLSEQAPHIIAAARHIAAPRLLRSDAQYVYVSADELVHSLRTTSLGLSSVLHVWDAENDRFVGAKFNGQDAIVVIDGMDEQTCESYVKRFLDVGSMLRRLDNVVQSIQKSSKSSNPTLLAFTHALSTVLDHIKNLLAGDRNREFSSSPLSEVWLDLEDIEETCVGIAEMCSRDMSVHPSQYQRISNQPTQILTLLWNHIANHTERNSSKTLIALLAYMLTMTSRPFFREIVTSVGLDGMEEALRLVKMHAQRNPETVGSELPEDDDASSERGLDLAVEDTAHEDFPVFFSEDIIESLVRARRSLRILAAAESHWMSSSVNFRPQTLEWFWTEEDLSSLLLESEPRGKTHLMQDTLTPASARSGDRTYKPDIAQLLKYNEEPGSHFRSPLGGIRTDLDIFLHDFPAQLPSIAPTIPNLTDLVFTPLFRHALSLSKASLRIFMTPSATLHLRSHLVLLRSYLLLTADAFKTRLSTALFSDCEEDDDESAEGLTVLTRRTPKKDVGSRPSGPWAVGLAYGLIDRNEWPPGGSDLAFYLRRVIMDSLEPIRETERDIGSREFWSDAEARIGFAIRDLPVGTGRDKWLDPTLIEALDFLYMEYKVPGPLQCLITQDILSKYQRIFTFLLRLMRVQNVLRLLYRLTRDRSSDLFSSIPAGRVIMLQFRFAAQSFVSVLSSYIYETAIGGNYDAFLACVAAAEKEDNYALPGKFSDVYSLMKYHSKVLDDILSACVLRSSQHTIGDLLRSSLDTLLEFGVLVGNVKSTWVKPEDGAPRLEHLYGKFKKQVILLGKALKKVSDRGPSAKSLDTAAMASAHAGRESKLPAAPGGLEALGDLFARLGGGEWWKDSI